MRVLNGTNMCYRNGTNMVLNGIEWYWKIGDPWTLPQKKTAAIFAHCCAAAANVDLGCQGETWLVLSGPKYESQYGSSSMKNVRTFGSHQPVLIVIAPQT